eukprot:scaffold92113_cov33-Tisochrysis_lutea.AAC.1
MEHLMSSLAAYVMRIKLSRSGGHATYQTTDVRTGNRGDVPSTTHPRSTTPSVVCEAIDEGLRRRMVANSPRQT